MSLRTILYLSQIVVSVVLIIVILLQAKGAGLGGIFGSDTSSVFRTKRGLEKTLFQATIVLSVLFILISVFSVRLALS